MESLAQWNDEQVQHWPWKLLRHLILWDARNCHYEWAVLCVQSAFITQLHSQQSIDAEWWKCEGQSLLSASSVFHHPHQDVEWPTPLCNCIWQCATFVFPKKGLIKGVYACNIHTLFYVSRLFLMKFLILRRRDIVFQHFSSEAAPPNSTQCHYNHNTGL